MLCDAHVYFLFTLLRILWFYCYRVHNIHIMLVLQGLGAIITSDLQLPDATAMLHDSLYQYLIDTFGTNLHPKCPDLPIPVASLNLHKSLQLAASKLQDVDDDMLMLQQQMQRLATRRVTRASQYLQASVAVNNDNEQMGLPFTARTGLGDSDYMARTLLQSRQLIAAPQPPVTAAATNPGLTNEQLRLSTQAALMETDLEQHDEF